MNVMNIKHYLSVAAALVMFAACSDYDAGMSENVEDYTVEELAVIKEYEANFIERYGEIDPNHTWGFGEKGSEDEMGTRISYPNSNMWVHCTKSKVNIGGAEVELVTDFTIPEGRTIPGFPVHNYYLSNSYNTSETVHYPETQTPPTNYEGWYHCKFPNETDSNGKAVEHWFSSKEAVISYMQGNNSTGTRYYELIPLGDVAACNTLTDAEVADVYAEFSKEWHGTNPELDLSSYFVQQVWRGTETYPGTMQNGTVVYVGGGQNMDYLFCDGGAYDENHFYNFNGSTYQNDVKGMMLIIDGNTTNFGYHNSLDSGDYYDHYRLVQLHGNWYVGFDFESNGADEKKIDRDYRYNDWIVKIIPGDGIIEDHQWYRIMCEDLGNTYDYDFNDLVYDVYFTGTAPNYVAHIKVQAVGGTLPIYINGQELHQLLGASARPNGLYNPINVGGEKRDPQYMVLTMSTTDPDDIEIGVPASGKNRKNNDFILPKSHGGTTVSKAPQKICIPGNTTKWMKESKQIESSYKNFDMWVNNQNGMYGFGNSRAWNTWSYGIINTENLYNP